MDEGMCSVGFLFADFESKSRPEPIYQWVCCD